MKGKVSEAFQYAKMDMLRRRCTDVRFRQKRLTEAEKIEEKEAQEHIRLYNEEVEEDVRLYNERAEEQQRIDENRSEREAEASSASEQKMTEEMGQTIKDYILGRISGRELKRRCIKFGIDVV